LLRRLSTVMGLLLTLALMPTFAAWRPIIPEDLALTKSRTDPNADVEVLFREVRVRNESTSFGYPTNVVTEYIRMKIFTARGKDKYADVSIPYFGKSVVSGVEGRTIKPDGTIIELKSSDVYNKAIEKKAGQRVKAVTFALPAVEPGVIIEYRWTINKGEYISRYVPLEVQSDYPVDEVSFHLKPVTGVYVAWPAMRYMPFGCTPDEIRTEMDGFSVLTLHNVPAVRDEPWMPPAYAARQWILIYYEENDKSKQDKYWASLGRQLYSDLGRGFKVNGEVKTIAEQITTGATSDDAKIARLLEYCRTNLKDINGEEISNEARANASKENNTTLDTLHRKAGNARDINLAFVALAQGAGFDAYLAKLSERASFLFNPIMQSGYFLNSTDSAVKVDGKWKFYDVTNSNLAPGWLDWKEQGVYALLLNPKGPEFVKTPLLTSAQTQVNRIAQFEISNDGVLSGDVREIHNGNNAIDWRERFQKANAEQREQFLRDDLKQRFADFDLTDVGFSVPTDLAAPIDFHYHIVVRGYAQRTGKRIFISPAFFQAGEQARFTDSVRTQGIYFRYPWSELDNIEIQLPDGYSLDHGDAPGGVNFQPFGKYAVKISISKTNKLLYQRQLTFGNDSILLFDAKAYPTLKQIFEGIYKADAHALTLKTDAATGQGL
jgi:transglutaminase-like putative cysteine protease